MNYKSENIGKQKKIPAFTLVELLVVMTIVAIISTLGSIYIFGHFADSRDAVRITDISNIEKTLNVYYSSEWNYPTPDLAVDLMYNWSVAWTQGVFGSGVTKTMKVFGSEVPSDPNYNVWYAYSVANRESEFQIAGVLEWEVEEEGLGEIISLVVPQTHAAVERAIVRGDYNNFMVKVSTWSTDYYIATPSLISSDLWSIGVIDTIVWRNLVYNDFFNLPATYSGSIDTNGWFNFNVSDPVIFEGTQAQLKTQDGLNGFADKLSYIYATTPTENFDIFRKLLDSENRTTTLKDFLSKNFRVKFSEFFDCRDIYDSGETMSGNYKIDPDGTWPEPLTDVYCDMDTWGGWWTQKDFSDVINGEFNWGNNITSFVQQWSTISKVNLGSGNTPVDSGYAMRQQGAGSYYRIWFENQITQIDELEVGDEIRLSLWVRDDSDTSWASWNGCTTTTCLLTPSPGYAFYNIMYGNDGLNDVNGFATTIDSVTTDDGRVWKHQLLRKKVTRELDDFFWDIWHGFWATKDIYITWVKTEVFYGWYE